MKFTKDETINITLIILSTISLIVSFYLSLNYIAWIAVLLCGIPIFKECIKGLIKEIDLKADILVTIAIIASILIGEVFAAGEIATIMAIGGFLEKYTITKTQGKIEKLINMNPEYATRIRNGTEEKISVEIVQVGDILKVLPGESIPTDGTIIAGETSINQSILTGESLPVDKKANDKVYSGTINLNGSFTMEVTKESHDSSVQKLIKLVESSSPENSRIVKTADKWATMIVVIAFTAALITYLLTFEITRSVTILVVFCPCALVLATPTAIMATIGNLTKHGILVKDGASIEELSHIDEIIFDKTGTLTYGTPKVVKVTSDDEEMMHLLSSLESKSEHPLAKAIVKHYNSNDYAHVEDFKMHVGCGVSGKINGNEIFAGNNKLLKLKNIKTDDDCENDEIVIYVLKNSKLIGKVYLKDTIRENTEKTIWNLKGLHVRTTLLTGDNEITAKNIAKEVKIRNVRHNCLPEDKLEYIKTEQVKGNRVAMIGDGLNDAPSLKKANVGIAMGEIGSDISVEAADIALVNDNIANIPHLIATSRKTIRTINICIGFSLSLNIIAMTLAILGIINPIEGALIHNIGSVIVIVYAYKLSNLKTTTKDYHRIKKLGLTKYLYNTIT